MGFHDELQDLPSELPVCSRCERTCEPSEVLTCTACRKIFCTYCTFRMGGGEFCSRSCGERIFFGEADEDGFTEDEV
jgi:hypothetical protein